MTTMSSWMSKVLIPALWENWPLVISTFLYIAEAIICQQKHKTGGMIMFIGYTIGNVGILVALL